MSLFTDSMIHFGEISRDEIPDGKIDAGEWFRDAESLYQLVEAGEAREVINHGLNKILRGLKHCGYIIKGEHNA